MQRPKDGGGLLEIEATLGQQSNSKPNEKSGAARTSPAILIALAKTATAYKYDT